VIFWDTSAVVPLIVDEPSTAIARQEVERDPSMIVWWATPIECLSAIARRELDRSLSRRSAEHARQALGLLAAAWTEVLAGEEVREHAGRLLLRHRLRTADALQLGAALTWARGRPRRHRIATLDERLAAAARGESFGLALPLGEGDEPG
jgi:predicted nucleic acid-binding protein